MVMTSSADKGCLFLVLAFGHRVTTHIHNSWSNARFTIWGSEIVPKMQLFPNLITLHPENSQLKIINKTAGPFCKQLKTCFPFIGCLAKSCQNLATCWVGTQGNGAGGARGWLFWATTSSQVIPGICCCQLLLRCDFALCWVKMGTGLFVCVPP